MLALWARSCCALRGGCRLQGLGRQDKAKLLAVLDEQVEANLGMAMIYAMVAAMQEYLQGLVSL